MQTTRLFAFMIIGAAAIIIGSKEIEQNYCLVKDLHTGLQEVVVFERLAEYFNKQNNSN